MFCLLQESKAYFKIPMLYKHGPFDFAYFSYYYYYYYYLFGLL